MMIPIGYTRGQEDSGRQVMSLLLATLRDKELPPQAAAGTPEEFQQRLMKLGKEEHLKIQRASVRALEDGKARRMADSRARATLRAGDWVISCREGEEGLEYDLAYALEGEWVLLALEGAVPLDRWQEEARYYWFVTLTFPRPEKPIRAGALTPAETCWLQRRLNLQPGAKLKVDGAFGPETQAALDRFQERRRQNQWLRLDPLEAELAELLDRTGTPW